MEQRKYLSNKKKITWNFVAQGNGIKCISCTIFVDNLLLKVKPEILSPFFVHDRVSPVSIFCRCEISNAHILDLEWKFHDNLLGSSYAFLYSTLLKKYRWRIVLVFLWVDRVQKWTNRFKLLFRLLSLPHVGTIYPISNIYFKSFRDIFITKNCSRTIEQANELIDRLQTFSVII